jgi:hypothetical protein
MLDHPLSWTLREIARLERGGGDREPLRPPRLTEPDQERWHRVRRKLGWVAFIQLLHDDLAEAFPTSFALNRWSTDPTTGLDEMTAVKMIDAAALPDEADRLGFLRQVCRGLGLREGGNIATLPKVQPHQRALELPGCGGRIAAYQVVSYGLAFHENFTFVADTDAERVAVGIAAAELRANAPRVLTSVELRAERPRFDHVFGIAGYPPAERLNVELGLNTKWA